MIETVSSTWRERAKSLGLVVVSVLMTLLVLEGAARVRQYVKFGTANTSPYKLTVDAKTGLPVPTPGQVTQFIRIDSRGFRNPELTVPKPEGVIRIAFLGASTTFCAEASSNEATWPHLVWKWLQDKWPDVTFDYVNAGVPGYTVEDSLINLNSRVASLQPDVIEIYHATNDLSKDTREIAIRQGLFQGRAENPSLIARYSLVFFLLEKNWQLVSRQRQAVGPGRHLEFDPLTLSQGFHQRLRALVEASQNVAPVVVVATFSHRIRPEQSPQEQLRASNTSLYYMPYMSVQGILGGFEAYNGVIREVARETGAILIDGENSIPGDARYFIDSVHFTDAGSELMARRVFLKLSESPEFNELLESRRTGSSRK
jgi:lysophospholipase L1-like esterase